MDWKWDWLSSPEMKLAVAGALGGVVRWLTLKQGWPDNFISITVGAIFAAMGGPFVLHILRPVIDLTSVDAAPVATFSGFVSGLGGIVFAGIIMDVINIRRRLLRKENNDDAT